MTRDIEQEFIDDWNAGKVRLVSDNTKELLRLKACVKEFFDSYLNVTEESDSGRLFHPISISCGRALKLEPLEKLLEEMQALSEAKRLRRNHDTH